MEVTRVTGTELERAAEFGVFKDQIVVVVGEAKTGKTELVKALSLACAGTFNAIFAAGSKVSDAAYADYIFRTIVGDIGVFEMVRSPKYTPIGDMSRKFYEVLFEEPGWELDGLRAKAALKGPLWPRLEKVLSRAAIYPAATHCCSAQKMQFIEVINYEPIFATTDYQYDVAACHEWWVDELQGAAAGDDLRGYYDFSDCNKLEGDEYVPFAGKLLDQVSAPFVVEAEKVYKTLAEADREYARLAAEHVCESQAL